MIDYRSAGVDIAAGNEAVSRIKSGVESTFSSAVLTDIGSFGALYDLREIMDTYQHPVLVQSIDGVGTKMMVATMMQKFDTIGADLVSATTNDIIVLGAKPLTLLDYIANDKLHPAIVEKIVMGMVQACRENGISLVGGETAEMPGTYLTGEHDLVGVITGVVDKDKVILGKNIEPGDVVLGLSSSGLHTNGYSLARKLFFSANDYQVDTYIPELANTLGETLLTPHINYTRPVAKLLAENIAIKGMAHITGGGLLENIPRILPKNCDVKINKGSWPMLPIFPLMQKLGNLPEPEMYRTFNMSLGLIIVLSEDAALQAKACLSDSMLYEVGKVVAGNKKVILS